MQLKKLNETIFLTKTAILLLGILSFLSCREPNALENSKKTNAGNYTFKIKVDSLEREYVLHIPVGYRSDHSAPVVIMLHGGGGTAQDAMQKTGWCQKADQEGFIVVFPEGTRPNSEAPPNFFDNPQTWNDGSGRESIGAIRRNVDDVKFIKAVIEDIIKRFNVEQKQIYAAGFSNGGAMVFRVGRELSNLLTAIACVASTDWLEAPSVKEPVAMLYMTGTADRLNPINGGEIFIGQTSYGTKPPVRQTIQKWVDMLHCPTDSTIIYDHGGVLGIAYTPCNKNTNILFYTIEEMGHWWPGGTIPSSYPTWLLNILGKPSNKIRATDVIWEFFSTHHKD